MELGQSTAFLGAFVASGVLSVVLAYIAKITQFRMALNLWSLGYALNAARLLVYSVAGISPPGNIVFFFVEGCQLLQSLALFFGVLSFVGKSPSVYKHLLPAIVGTVLLSVVMTYAWNGGAFRLVPFYGLAAIALFVAGVEIIRCKEIRENAGYTFTAITLILWSLHKLDFILLPNGFSGLAQIRFMLSAGFYTAAALGFSIMALSVFHRRLSQTLIDNEAHFRKMFEDAPVGYQSLDEEGKIVAVNRRWLDMLGYAADEVVGRPFGDFLAAGSRPKFPGRFAEFKRIGVTSGVEFELIRKDGRKLIGAFEGRINPSGDSGVIRIHCVLSDVTERREKEALISRFGRIIDQTFNEVFVFDAETLQFIHANKGALVNTGFSLAELTQMTATDLGTDFTREAFDGLIAPLRNGERETVVFETRYRRKDGSTYDVEARLQLMADEVPPVFVAVARDISARKAAETARRASEGLLHGVTDHSPASIYVKDTAGRFIMVNREFERRNALTADLTIGRTSHDILPKKIADDVIRRERLAREAGDTHEEEVEFTLPDGQRRFLLSAKFPVFDDEGRLLGVGSVSTDVTKMKVAERALRESEARLQAIMDHSPAAIVLRDSEDRFVLANREYLRRTGQDAADVLGRTLADVESEEVAQEAAVQDRQVAMSGRPQMFHVTRPYKNGGEMRLAVVRFVVPSADGSVANRGAIGLDVTEWKKAEEARQESETRLLAIMEHSPVAIVLRDLDGRFLAVNREYLRRTGKREADVLGRTLDEVDAEDIAREVKRQEAAMLASGQSCMFQVTRLSPAGEERTSAVMRFPVPAADGSITAAGAISIDITEWAQAKEALRLSEARLQAIMEHSPASIFLKDRDGHIIVANREYLRRRGLAAEDALGRTSFDLEAKSVAEEIQRQEREVLAIGASKMFHVTRRFADGQDWTLAIVRFPVLAADGGGIGVGGIGFDVSKWRKAEAALTLSEARLQAIMDYAPAEIMLKDREGRYLIANEAYLRRKGRRAEEVLGKTIAEFSSERDAQEVRAWDEQVITTRQARNFQAVRTLPDGGKVTFAIVRFPLFDSAGEVASIGVVSIDVTRERQAEMALRENEEKLRLVLQSTGEGIYAIDLEGYCTLCNPAAARILGYDDPDELLAHDIHGLIHHSRADGRAYPLDECQIHRAIVEGRLIHADDEVFWRRDGRPILVEFRSNPVVQHGTIVGTVVSFADISERKRAEAWLLRLSQSVEQSPFGVLITDGERKIEYANPSFFRETGYTMEDLKGRRASILNVDGPDSASDREIGETILAGRQWRGEIRQCRKSGDVYWAAILISPIRDEAGKTVAYVTISEDISERRRMAEHLRQAQKMEAVGQLTGGIAHDFNNILSVILTSAECLADDLEGEAEMGSLVATIVRAVHRAAGLTERLLAFSRRQDLSPEVMDLGTVVCDMADMLRRSLGETIVVSVQAEADVPPVVVDRGQFENALLNLAVNARDAMPQGGSLTVRVARGDLPVAGDDGNGRLKRDFVCVTVTDSGTGMSADVAERVFEPFFTTKAKGQGTGLGLSMVYGFVTQSGGDIVVDSVENEGTSFHLYFPVAEGIAAVHGIQTVEGYDDSDVLPSLTMVLAEDDDGVRMATKFILENTGHRVMDAENGVEALEILKRLSDVDLLVTDVIMPGGMSGRDLAEAARAINPHLKVLFTSGYADGRLSMGDIIPGATAFVSKPYTKESLIDAVRSLWFSRGAGPTDG